MLTTSAIKILNKILIIINNGVRLHGNFVPWSVLTVVLLGRSHTEAIQATWRASFRRRKDCSKDVKDVIAEFVSEVKRLVACHLGVWLIFPWESYIYFFILGKLEKPQYNSHIYLLLFYQICYAADLNTAHSKGKKINK